MTTKANNTAKANATVVENNADIVMKSVFIENVNEKLKHKDEYITSQVTARRIYDIFKDKDARVDFTPTLIKCNKATGEPYAIKMMISEINKSATIHINNLKLFKTEDGDLINEVYELKEDQVFPTLKVEGIKIARAGVSDKDPMKYPIRFYSLMNGGHEYNGETHDYKGDWNEFLKLTQLGELISEEGEDEQYKLKDGMYKEVGAAVKSIYAGGIDTTQYIGIDKIEKLEAIINDAESTRKTKTEAQQQLDEFYEDGLTTIYPTMTYTLTDVRTK